MKYQPLLFRAILLTSCSKPQDQLSPARVLAHQECEVTLRDNGADDREVQFDIQCDRDQAVIFSVDAKNVREWANAMDSWRPHHGNPLGYPVTNRFLDQKLRLTQPPAPRPSRP